MFFQDWSYKRDNFYVTIIHDPIPFGDYKYLNRKEVIKGDFRESLYYLNWAVTLGPIRS